MLFALFVPWLLTDRPRDAGWLSREERDLLESRIAADQPPAEARPRSAREVVGNSRVLRFVYVYFAIQIGVHAVSFWLPPLVARIGGLSDTQIGVISALPWVFALAGVLLLPGNRHGPLLIAPALVVVGLVGGAVLPPVAAIGALCVAAFGSLGAQPVFWIIPPTVLAGVQLAAAIPLVSGIGHLGGFVGPSSMGLAVAGTRAPGAGLYVVAVPVAAGLTVALTFRWIGRPAPEAPAPAVVSVAEEA